MKTKRRNFSIYEMIIFMFITAVVSSLTCGYLMFKIYDSKKVEPSYDYSKITDNGHLQEFINTYGQILDKYYKDIEEDELVDSAIKGMLDHLGEPYTEYLEEDRADGFNEQLKGEYEGIGVVIWQNSETNQIIIQKVFPDSPAEKSGVKVGDIFVSVNGNSVEGKTAGDVSEEIKYGEKATSDIIFLRGEQEIRVSIKRERVANQSADGRIIKYKNKNVGYLEITTFATNTSSQVKEVLKDFKNQGLKEVIIDVRGNTGGYLESVMSISEQFLEKGKTILYLETKGEKTAITDSTDEKTAFKIVILVDSASASASEILAGALKYSYGAEIVGTRTYGKGKFQETGELSSGATIKYTAGMWNMPNDVNIDGIGISPDHEVILNEDYYNNRNDESDNQLQKALEIVTK